MKDLSNKEREKFSLQAAKWNHLRAPAVVKSQVAEKRSHKMMVSYVNQCWDKQVEAYVFLKLYLKFLYKNCKPFLKFCNIKINGEADLIPMGTSGRNKKCKENLQLSKTEEGQPKIPNPLGTGAGQIAVIMRDYMSGVYALAMGKDIPVPWAEVTANPKSFFRKKWLPKSKHITNPSKMHLSDMVEMLEKICDDPGDSFEFKVGNGRRRKEEQLAKKKHKSSKAKHIRKGKAKATSPISNSKQTRQNHCQDDPKPQSDLDQKNGEETDDEIEAALQIKSKKKPYIPSESDTEMESEPARPRKPMKSIVKDRSRCPSELKISAQSTSSKAATTAGRGMRGKLKASTSA
ncbi:hypothetical protein JAAARDRAFT_198305 [Jaapia argillacea MUCL 33604]|uniref:Uncharacterized protein n=1 Tax=Jaapia argillacea MUCL 33604 TaxID=933084 RepID=A0A067PEW5_9AGAM|nr:hypothetical protein JAAARDRAFT_198305 [Jaapia argillacea MUCL 33604]